MAAHAAHCWVHPYTPLAAAAVTPLVVPAWVAQEVVVLEANLPRQLDLVCHLNSLAVRVAVSLLYAHAKTEMLPVALLEYDSI